MTGTDPGVPAGVIHDIGYRHYDGRRLGHGYIVSSLVRHGLRTAYGLGRPARSKVVPFGLLAAMLMPALVSLVLTATVEEVALISYSGYQVYLQLVIAIFLAAQAPNLASRDLRHRVVPLYFSRPLSRADYVGARYGALAGALFLLCAAPLTLLFAGALLISEPWRDNTVDYLRALAGAALLALVLAALGLLIAAITPRRGLAVAGIITIYLVSSAVAQAVQGISEAEGNDTLAEWVNIATPFFLVDGIVARALGATPSTPVPPPEGVLGLVAFVAVAAALVAGSLLILLARYRKAGRA